MSALRRYEILLPSRFTDGRPVPPDLIADTLQEKDIWLTTYPIEVI
jgi:hypothetical protein